MSVKASLDAATATGAVPHTRLSAIGPNHGGVRVAFLPNGQTSLAPGQEFDAVLSAYFNERPEGRTFTCQMLVNGRAVFIIGTGEAGEITIRLPDKDVTVGTGVTL